MNMAEFKTFLQGVSWLGSRPGLSRITDLLARLGNPERSLSFVHVAGTNGKGSVSAMLSAILTRAGYRTGTYTSPHLLRWNERMQVDGTEISDRHLCELAEQVKSQVDAMEDKPTEFELMTAMALLYFSQQRCDVVVLEVGLGGRLDATNVIPAPEVAVITRLGLEHTDILGDTIQQIAAEKGGIIKAGCTAVSYENLPEAMAVLETRCQEQGVSLFCARRKDVVARAHSLEGQWFDWKDWKGLFLPLLGIHQLYNASVALEGVEALRRRGWHIDDGAIRQGLAKVQWPARFELLSQDPLFILDGGHNPQCVEALSQAVAAHLPGQPVSFLVGVLEDKDYERMMEQVIPLAKRFICVTPNSERALSASRLAQLLQKRGCEAECLPSVEAGVERCLSWGDSPVVAFGSLYMAGEIREALAKLLKKNI